MYFRRTGRRLARGEPRAADPSKLSVRSETRRSEVALLQGGSLADANHGAGREDAARVAADRWRYLNLMGDRAPNTDTGEPETSSDALLDELVRALARQAAERDYEALRNKTRRARRPTSGQEESR